MGYQHLWSGHRNKFIRCKYQSGPETTTKIYAQRKDRGSASLLNSASAVLHGSCVTSDLSVRFLHFTLYSTSVTPVPLLLWVLSTSSDWAALQKPGTFPDTFLHYSDATEVPSALPPAEILQLWRKESCYTLKIQRTFSLQLKGTWHRRIEGPAGSPCSHTGLVFLSPRLFWLLSKHQKQLFAQPLFTGYPSLPHTDTLI